MGEKVPMVLFVEDLEHLEKVKSPMLKVCLQHGVENKSYSNWLEQTLKYEQYA
jgi:hypothetical protein